jgi:hypothetical protein
METPVIYFYSNKKVEVNVKVDFPQGIVSQWFPDVTKINPSIEAKNGHASWDVTVLNETRGNLPRTTPSSIWNPSREVRSNIIEAKKQREKLIFYRGLGDFKTPLLITYNKENVTIQNQSDQEIKGLVLLNNRESSHQYIEIESLAPHTKRTVSLVKNSPSLESFPNFSEFLRSAKKTIIKHLVRSGLYRDESVAMLNTWEKGYFKTQGLRLLYVLPTQWTEEILPLKFTPSPKEVIRTLVGRIEILSKQDDKEISNFVKKYFIDGNLFVPQINGREMLGLGHFPEPKLRRALQLNFDNATKEKIKRTITTMNQSLRN